jgi:hypothetical protein
MNEEALAQWGLSRQKQTNKDYFEKNTNCEVSRSAVFLQTFEFNLKKSTVDAV